MKKKQPKGKITDKKVKDLENKDPVKDTQQKNDVERVIDAYVIKRSEEMKEYRKNLSIEKMWKEADKEYIPSDLTDVMKNPRKIFEADQETGLRSKMVRVGADEENWRNTGSDPMLLVKIMSAMAVIIDKNPDAILTAMAKKYEGTSALAQAIWKRSWSITNSKENLKLFVLNLCKYGWSVGRTYPKKLSYKKSILDESYGDEKKYIEEERILYNDLCRETMDPRYTWLDENAKPYDSLSCNEVYYELEYSYDLAKAEFHEHPNFEKYVKKGMASVLINDEDLKSKDEEKDKKRRDDIVRLGFFESRLKDLFVIKDLGSGAIIHHCPLPNDDGMLSLWHTMWILRSSTSPYGVSLWEIIRNDKQLYDKMSNMTMDQLVLSIMKMFFYTGTSTALGDGKIKIKPGYGKQIVNGEVKWLDIPGPGEQSWTGLQHLKSRADDNSGISPTIEGEVTGKTLGEIITAKEQALKRLKLPLENISDAVEQDAYISLSWASQIYSTPEVKEFASINEIIAYEEENETKNGGVYPVMPTEEEMPEPQPQLDEITGEPMMDEMGEPMMQPQEEPQPKSYKAAFYPQLALHLDDSDGKLVEGKESRYFQVGDGKLKPSMLKWKGIFKVLPRSILSPSLELDKMRKTDVFNIIVPLLPGPKEIYGKAVKQLLKVNEEDAEDWLPEDWLSDAPSLFTPVAPGQPQQGGGDSMQAQGGTTPNQGGQKVVPSKMTPAGMGGSLFDRKL